MFTVTHCARQILINTSPHQLCWSYWECGHYTTCTCNMYVYIYNVCVLYTYIVDQLHVHIHVYIIACTHITCVHAMICICVHVHVADWRDRRTLNCELTVALRLDVFPPLLIMVGCLPIPFAPPPPASPGWRCSNKS